MTTYCFDLDGTLCTNTEGDYEAARPQPWAIDRVNTLKRAGHTVVIFTARGTTTGIDWRPQTEGQLADWGVEYDELILGKPYADVYIDDKALHADAWRYGPAHELRGPGHAPLRGAAAVEVGRTFGGRPLYLRDHAERLRAATGIAPADVEAAVAESTERGRELLDPDDDVVFSIALEHPPSAAYLDTIDGAPGPELTVSCRLLSQPARALARYGDPAAISAATDAREANWPLRVGPDGALADTLGGTLAAASDGVLTMPQSRDVAALRVVELAGRAGFEVSAGSVTPDTEELLIVGMPFCVLGVSELDGRQLRMSGARDALLAAWSEECGIDLAAQLATLI